MIGEQDPPSIPSVDILTYGSAECFRVALQHLETAKNLIGVLFLREKDSVAYAIPVNFYANEKVCISCCDVEAC